MPVTWHRKSSISSGRTTNEMKRIIIIGTSCSGKSTAAKQLSDTLDVPYIELDALNWLPDWTERDPEAFKALVGDALSATEEWVLDGNYSRVRDMSWARADTILWLNYPFRIVFYRALKRTFRRVIYKEKLFAGNVETFRQQFLSHDSILLWVLITHRRNKKRYAALIQNQVYSHIHFHIFNKPSELERFLASLKHRQHPH